MSSCLLSPNRQHVSGVPEAGYPVNLMNVKVEPMETSSEDGKYGNSRHSPSSQFSSVKVEEANSPRIRSESFSSTEEGRRSSINAQFIQNNAVCVWNDRTGQSVVVSSNQSTKDALASLCLRDLEAKRMDDLGKITFKREEDRTDAEKQLWKMYMTEMGLKQKEKDTQQFHEGRIQQLYQDNLFKKQMDPLQTAILEQSATVESANRARANRNSSRKRKNQKPPARTNVNSVSGSSTPAPYVYRPRATTFSPMMIRTEPNKPKLPVMRPYVRRNTFGMSRFLDTSSSEQSSSPSPVPTTSNGQLANNYVPTSHIGQSKHFLMMQEGANPSESSTNNNDTPVNLPALEDLTNLQTSTADASPRLDGPQKDDPNQMAVVVEGPVQQTTLPMRHQSPPLSPVQRSKSTPPKLDEDLIAFLRGPLALAKKQEEEALRKKLTDPPAKSKPKRKPRLRPNRTSKIVPNYFFTGKTPPTGPSAIVAGPSAQREEKPIVKNNRSMSTPSNFLDEAESHEKKPLNLVLESNLDPYLC